MRIPLLSHAPGQILEYRRDGRPILPIAGGSGEEPAAGEPAGTDPDPSGTDGDPEKDWKAEAEKWSAMAKKHEARARDNADKARQYDELERLHQSESERAVSDARTEGEKAAADKYRGQIARHAVVAAAATAKVSIPENALKRMDLTDLVDDDGQVDTDALTELVSGFAPIPDTGTGGPRQLPPDPAQRGRNRGNGGKTSADDRLAAGAELYRTHFPMKS